MAKIGLPNLNITFVEQGIARIGRSERGIVALVLQDKTVEGKFNIYSVSQMPKGLSKRNQKQVELALMGYQKSPRKLILVVEKEDELEEEGELSFDIKSDAFKYLESVRFDYLAIPFISKKDSKTVATWIKTINDNYHKRCKAVLPNEASDYEKIINYTMPAVGDGEDVYETNAYTSRIAGFLAGTPMQIASTFGALPELVDCTYFNKEELEEKIGKGELVLMNDGEKIKIARGVNSLTTTSEIKGESFRKIKIVDIMDAMADDIQSATENAYLGKYANTYDNKCLLISAIKGYMEVLENDSLLAKGQSRVEIDLEAQKAFLDSIGYKTIDGRVPDEMEIKELKEADTKDKVFLKANCKVLDAIEEIDLKIVI